MIKLKSLILEQEGWNEKSDIHDHVWYHGRTIDNEIFSLDYVGVKDAFNQEGPGFYFTNDLLNAKRYAYPDGIILKCGINYKKLIIKNMSPATKPNKKIIIKLIQESPNKDDTLINFDENSKIAFDNAINAYLNYPDAWDSYQTIQNDFYKYNEKEYLIEISKYYDGQLTKLSDGVYHLIIYNPTIINIIDKLKI